MNNKNNRRQQPNIYINIAPLVEVMLVLIIIFMITAPMLNVGVPVDLPKTKAATLAETKASPIVISIDKNSQIFVEEAKVTLEELVQKLPLIVANGKTDTVYVRGDKELQYGQIMKIMGIIAATGACKVSLISEAATDADMSNISEITAKNAPASRTTNEQKPKQPQRRKKGR
jgi:biopolymer transport protein TolR